jgi:hypothetical protein
MNVSLCLQEGLSGVTQIRKNGGAGRNELLLLPVRTVINFANPRSDRPVGEAYKPFPITYKPSLWD